VTVIVAARTKGNGVVMAADSQTSAGWEKIQADRAKLWTAGQYLIGAAGNVRAAQVIRHHTTWPKWRPDEVDDVEAFLVKQIVPAIRTAVAGSGVVETRNGAETIPVSLLIAWEDHIADISGDYCALRPRTGRYAIGSGYAEALGHLGPDGPWTRSQVIEAARRSTVTAHGCDGPIVVGDTRSLSIVEVE
jgi:ATP-dependent protease HslVU (ClpYQ) peptidase subunit